MISNQFRISLFTRVSLIVLSSLILAYTVFYYKDYLIISNIIFVIGVQAWLLIRYINKINFDLANFFLSVQFDDTSVKFQKHKYGKSFDQIYQNLEDLNEKFKQLRLAEEKQSRFLRAIADHVKIGIIVFDIEGNIDLSNKAALEIFDLAYLKKLSQLDNIQKGFANKLIEANSSSREVITIEINNNAKKILVRANEYKVLDKELKILSFQNIISELDEQEVDSWQKLIRILSHEIMNSVGPIKSSIETMEKLLQTDSGNTVSGKELTQEIITDIARGIEIVKERSIGMSEFVEHFRSFTLLPKPVLKCVNVKELFSRIQYLFSVEFENNQIQFSSDVYNDEMEILADVNMVEQMIINLVQNAIQAEATNVELLAKRKGDANTVIEITDNGQGIEPENLDKIFIPFFTTKSSGSGVGLSLARQIMRYHQGSIQVHSEPRNYTVFRIIF